MQTTKLSTKGQVVLPKTIRNSRGWKPGTEFRVEEIPGGLLLRPVQSFPPSMLEDVAACLRYWGRPKTLEEMDQAIANQMRKRRGRGRF